MTQYEKAMVILAATQCAYLEAIAKKLYNQHTVDDSNGMAYGGVRQECNLKLVHSAPEAFEVIMAEVPK